MPKYPASPMDNAIGRHWNKYWTVPGSSIAQIDLPQPAPEERERRQIYCYLLLSLLTDYWNPWKYGLKGKYPLTVRFKSPPAQYLGHNIVCIAVDSYGRIIDFDFKHNDIFNSSLEHAEARLLRRMFALADHFQGNITFALPRVGKSGSLVNAALDTAADIIEVWESSFRRAESNWKAALKNLTLYTSLESCAQCSGMMALGAVSEVVFLQPDPGQNNICNVLFNLNAPDTAFKAPRHIPASAYGVSEFTDLDTACDTFKKNSPSQPFHDNGHRSDTGGSITSFLCTDAARDSFGAGQQKLRTFKPRFSQWKPTPTALTNRQVLQHAMEYARRAVAQGRRGTPH